MLRLTRELINLSVGSYTAGLSYAIVFFPPEQYLLLLQALTPVLLVFGVLLGGTALLIYSKTKVSTTMFVSVLSGAFLGSLPGILLAIIASGPSPGMPIPEELAIENAVAPILFAAFGGIGGFSYYVCAAMLRKALKESVSD